jgi:hypothetical protein
VSITDDIRRLQVRVGVRPDGLIGPATVEALLKALEVPTAAPPARLDVAALQQRIGVTPDGQFGPASKAALFAALTNLTAPSLTTADFEAAAAELGVGVNIIKAVRKVEAPRGPFDDQGRSSLLYERHIFAAESKSLFNKSHPHLSGPPYGPGGYGSFASQYDKLADACARGGSFGQLHPLREGQRPGR